MIAKISAQEGFAGFDRQFVTVLEIGGDYAHKIDPLLQFIGIPTLVIADIDSADAKRSPCPVAEGVCSTNAVIGSYLKEASDLKALRELAFEGKRRNQTQVVFQVDEDGKCGRSFEEAFIYANLEWIKANVDQFTAAAAFKKALKTDLAAEAYELGRKKLTKVEFALDLLGAEGWAAPAYIKEGLEWLSKAERMS